VEDDLARRVGQCPHCTGPVNIFIPSPEDCVGGAVVRVPRTGTALPPEVQALGPLEREHGAYATVAHFTRAKRTYLLGVLALAVVATVLLLLRLTHIVPEAVLPVIVVCYVVGFFVLVLVLAAGAFKTTYRVYRSAVVSIGAKFYTIIPWGAIVSYE